MFDGDGKQLDPNYFMSQNFMFDSLPAGEYEIQLNTGAYGNPPDSD